MRLKDNEKSILNEAISRSNVLDSKFVFFTVKMRDWLVDFKAKCDQFDRMYLDGSNGIEFVEKNKFDLETTLDLFGEMCGVVSYTLAHTPFLPLDEGVV